MYLLGFDIGSSSVKAALVAADTGKILAIAHSPETEMEIQAPAPGWAEQQPELWWTHACRAVAKIWSQTDADPGKVAAIGISYQMHGLVCLDRAGAVVRPSIIWCDSRAVEIGNRAFDALGNDFCLQHYLNSPGNFTASKLKWVRDHEPAAFERIHTVMLPGDYVAYRLTGERGTTVSGLSEGILWDFKQEAPATDLLAHYGINADLLAPVLPPFGIQGRLTTEAASAMGLPPGIPVTYRAGDQPNNALSLNVLNPGEVAATGGTSGVIYGVVDQLIFDAQNRVNSFAHVNHTSATPRIGVLLCINGAGILYGWLRRQLTGGQTPYAELEQWAASVPTGADGLRMLPFGNGAERMLGNRVPGAQMLGLDFNRHDKTHMVRAALEGIAFSFVYGASVLQELGLDVSILRVGNDNLFQSAVFSNTIATLLGCRIELLRTTGAAGAAIASGTGIGLWKDPSEGLGALEQAGVYEPGGDAGTLQEAYAGWKAALEKVM